ncbi:MAG: hypothetical protein AAGG38_03010 [Planctomycetota bacterium]
MGRRQSRTPPYEIMRHVGSGTPLPRSPMKNVRGGSVGFFGAACAAVKRAGLGATRGIPHALSGGLRGIAAPAKVTELAEAVHHPVGLRLPGWLWALLGVTALAIMGLMFQIGQHVAGRSAASSPPPAVTAYSGGTTDVLPGGTVVAMGEVPIPSSEMPGGGIPLLDLNQPGLSAYDYDRAKGGIAVTDPREPGRNYYILSTVRPSEVAEVRKLQAFLAEGGLATYLDSTNNGAFRQLVDVTRGYTKAERRQGLHDAHELKIRELGQRWKRHNKGLGTDLSDLYPDYYRGPSP